MLQVVTIANRLASYLGLVLSTSHALLHYLTSCVQVSHGLSSQPIGEDMRPVIEDLRSLAAKWASMDELAVELGRLLTEARESLEKAMDPDRWGVWSNRASGSSF